MKSQPEVNSSQISEATQTALTKAVNEAIAENITSIAVELIGADDGNLSLSIPIKLALIGGRVSGKGSISFSRKFKGEFEFITEDPNQERLPV